MRFIHQTMLVVAVLGLSSALAIASARDQALSAGNDPPSVVAENSPSLPAEDNEIPAITEAEPPGGDDETIVPDTEYSEDEFNLGEIPDIQSVELALDLAKRALDTWLMVRDKYKDAELEAYDDLQEFVDKNEQGAAFEADIKTAGFASVSEWNVAITSLGFAYSATVDDPSAEITAQIEEIKMDDTIAQDLKDRMVASLGAMIPSENNKKVVQDLLADPAYKPKLEELEAGEEYGE